VGNYKLSARARTQIHEIYDYSAETFGSYQADAYHAGLERTFGPLAEELAARHRRFRFQAHHIFYTEEHGHIVIRAIYHHSREIRPELFD
jgi:toxin ParE1/3/4